MSSPRKVVVIGAGPAGYVCAIRLAQLGQQVTLVEKGPLGGTCLNVGCIPSKALIAAGSLLQKIGRAGTMGIDVAGVELDVGRLVEWKGGSVDRLTRGVGGLLENHGVTLVRGSATLVDRHTVEVEGDQIDGGQTRLSADDLVLATGSRPIDIPGFTPDGDAIWSSTEALSPQRIPEHLVVIGGGYIGLELGMMYRKLGAQVTVIEALEDVLVGQDPDCVKVIRRSCKKQKIRILTESTAGGWERVDSGLELCVTTGGGEERIACDQILSTVGRRPMSDGLGLDRVGLAVDERGFLPVDSRLRTAVDNIYAIGDLAGQPMLAHKGSKEGLVAAGVIAGQPEEYDVRCVPAVVFTSPELASVGLTEPQCAAEGRAISTGTFPFAASGRAMSLMETEGFVKVIADAESDELLGVHMVGPEVTELIAEAALALEMGATSQDLARTIHAHPSLPEALMEAAEDVHGLAVHIFHR